MWIRRHTKRVYVTQIVNNLCDSCAHARRHLEAAAIEKQLLNLEPMKGPQEASKTIETIEHGTRLHNSMAIVHILEQDMHSFLWRTVPKEFVQLMLQLGNSVSTYPELKERLLN